MRKVIFFDIDGTLVDFKGQMPDTAKEALVRAHEKGHQLVICSGRAKCQIYPFLLKLGFDGIVGGTGSYVEYKGKMVYEHFIPKEYLGEAISVLDQAQALYSCQTREGMVVPGKHSKTLLKRFEEMGVGSAAMDQIWRRQIIDDHIEEREDVQKFIYHDSQWMVDKIAGLLKDHYTVTPSSFEKEVYDSGELTLKGIDKAYGMQKYIDAAKVDRKDTVAVGDGPNDYDMLEFAAFGIAMGNARDTLKQRADYVTTGINEDGIAHALKHLHLV